MNAPPFRCPRCNRVTPKPNVHAHRQQIRYRCECRLEVWTFIDNLGLVYIQWPLIFFNRQGELTASNPFHQGPDDESSAGEAWKNA